MHLLPKKTYKMSGVQKNRMKGHIVTKPGSPHLKTKQGPPLNRVKDRSYAEHRKFMQTYCKLEIYSYLCALFLEKENIGNIY